MLKFIESNFNEQNDININNSINKININNEEENKEKNISNKSESCNYNFDNRPKNNAIFHNSLSNVSKNIIIEADKSIKELIEKYLFEIGEESTGLLGDYYNGFYGNNKNFQKLKEIEKDYPMEAHQPFEIKENIVGAYWNFDDAENDETISDNEGGD